MESTKLDLKFLADERELYDELQLCTDENELLIVMSDIQAHFQEELKKQQDLMRERYAQIAKEKEKEKENHHDPFFFKNNTNITSLMTAGITSTATKFQFQNHNTVQHTLQISESNSNKRKLDLSIPLLTPRTKYGTYRLELFCDIKFVKNIFVRWISSSSEILSHVTSRTLAVLFSHAYLNSDQMLDLAELLLGVHEREVNYPMENVGLMNRASRSGVLYGCAESMSDDSNSSSMEECSSLSDLSEEKTTHTPPNANRLSKNKEKKNKKKVDKKNGHFHINSTKNNSNHSLSFDTNRSSCKNSDSNSDHSECNNNNSNRGHCLIVAENSEKIKKDKDNNKSTIVQQIEINANKASDGENDNCSLILSDSVNETETKNDNNDTNMQYDNYKTHQKVAHSNCNGEKHLYDVHYPEPMNINTNIAIKSPIYLSKKNDNSNENGNENGNNNNEKSQTQEIPLTIAKDITKKK